MGSNIALVICTLWIMCAIFGADGFLFGTTGKNHVWIQNGTKEWIDLKQNPKTSVINFQQEFLGVHGTSYFFQRNYLVFSDMGAKSIFLTDISGQNKRSAFVYVGTSSSVGHLAVDWLSENIYWCDGTFGWIAMVSLLQDIIDAGIKKDFKMVAEKFLDVPSGIAVQPDHEWIFWTDIGRQPKIERSGLDGSNRHVLVLHGIIKPVSITADPKLANIVWTDPARGTIELCDFYGKHRKVIKTDVNAKYYGIETFSNFAIVSEQTKNEILVYNITNGNKVTNAYSPGYYNVSSIAFFTEGNQFISNSACSSRGCAQICLVKSSSQAECRCEDGYSLDSDGKKCTVQNKVLVRSIVFVNNSNICSLPITHINIHKYLDISPDCTLGGVTTGSITHLAIDVQNEELLYSVGNTIHRQTFYQTTNVLHTEDDPITGLSFDWITHRLYWTKAGQIKYLDKNSPSTVETLAVKVNNPTYLTASPIDDTIFVVSGGSSSKKIESIFLPNGTSVVLESTRLTDPKWLTYDRPKDRVYWIDGTSIGSMSSSGKGIHKQNIGGSDTLHGIGVYKDYVMWLQSSPTAVAMHVDNINSDQEMFNFPMPGMSVSPQTFVFFDKNIQPEKNVPCIKENSGCQQICYVYGIDPICDCHLGYSLQADGKSCLADTLESNFFLAIDSLNSKLLKLNGSSTIVALDTGHVIPTSTTVDYHSKNVIWIDERSSIKSVGIDGSNEVTITAESADSLTSVDVDSSTGNIYYTTKNAVKVYSASHSTKRTLLSDILSANSIEVYPEKGKMYWTENDVNGNLIIRQAYMDGSVPSDIRSYDADSRIDLAIDKRENRLILADAKGDTIESISLTNNNNILNLMSGTGEFPIAVDVDVDYIYYIGLGKREIRRINKADGTGSLTVFENIVIGRLTSLLKVSENQRSEHSLCKYNNGQCSRLCLPTGENQRRCQCSDSVNLGNDGKKCIGDVQCPDQFGDVILSSSCTRYAGSSCSFECKAGTSKSADYSLISCLQNEEWDVESGKLCQAIKSTDTEKASDGLGIGAIVGLAGGGIVILVVVVAMVVVFQLQKMRKETKKTRNEMRVVYKASSSSDHLRDLSASGYSNILNTRDCEETYEEIDDNKLFREKTQFAQDISSSSASHRYSRWPIDDQTNDPPPDYIDVIGSGPGNSPYLNPKFLAPKPDNTVATGGESPYLTPKSISNSTQDSRFTQERLVPGVSFGTSSSKTMHDNRGFQGSDETNPYLSPR